MNREFLINALFLVLVNLLIKPFYVFGIERVIQDRVGAETYGLYATLFSFSSLLRAKQTRDPIALFKSHIQGRFSPDATIFE